MSGELVAVLDGRETGRVVQDDRGRLSFKYNEPWRAATDAYPLSLSMPLALAEHGHAKSIHSCGGFCPTTKWSSTTGHASSTYQQGTPSGSSLVLARTAPGRSSSRGPKGLKPSWGRPRPRSNGSMKLRLLSVCAHCARTTPRDTGQFSLAGAQPKTALLFDNNRWGVPSGRVPTTHILKPPTGEFDGHAENEHFCLELGREIKGE
jgi:serine/threonine-protein kinase HipA